MYIGVERINNLIICPRRNVRNARYLKFGSLSLYVNVKQLMMKCR